MIRIQRETIQALYVDLEADGEPVPDYEVAVVPEDTRPTTDDWTASVTIGDHTGTIIRDRTPGPYDVFTRYPGTGGQAPVTYMDTIHID